MILDQTVLREIDSFRNESSNILAEHAVSLDDYARKISQFKFYLGPGPVSRKFVEACIDLIREKHQEKADISDGEISVLIRSLIKESIHDDFMRKEWLEKQIQRALDTSLRLVFSLWRLAPDGDSSSIRAYYIQEFLARMRSDGSYLGNVLDVEFPYTIHHVIRFRDEYSIFGKPTDWAPYFHLFVESATVRPDVVVPQLANFLIKDERVWESRADQFSRSFRFEYDFAELLIPNFDLRGRLVSQLRGYAKLANARLDVISRISTVEDALVQFADHSIDEESTEE